MLEVSVHFSGQLSTSLLPACLKDVNVLDKSPLCDRADTMCRHTDNEESLEEPIRFSSASPDYYWRRVLFMEIQTQV